MKLIVGLGNPGKRYDKTRHNVGFAVLDQLAEINRLSWSENNYKGLSANWEHKSGRVILLKPQTFMNLSGECVAPFSRYYRIEPHEILVVHDDLDLPCGRLRLARQGSPAGHNGLKSIIQHLNTPDFARLKMGIGRPVYVGQEIADFVVSAFESEEQKIIEQTLQRAEEAIEVVLSVGLDGAMNRFNSNNKK